MKIRSVGKISGFAKERKEHPSFTKAQVAQIIKDHTKVEKKSIEELLPKKKESKGFFVENAPIDEGAISERPLQASPVSSGDEAGKEDKYLTQIDQFYGTTRYYNVMGTQVTDGVKYLMDNGYSWVVTDAVAVLQAEPKVMGKKFVSIKLKRDATGECVIRYEDGNEKLLYQQKYSYTDAKVDVQMFYENGVLLLPSEH